MKDKIQTFWKIFVFTFLVFNVTCVFGQENNVPNNPFEGKTRLSLNYSYPYSSGELNSNIISIHRGIDYIKGGKWEWLHTNNGQRNFLKGSLRLIKLLAIDRPIAFNGALFNHEFIGHGLAIRDMNLQLDSLHVPFVYWGNPLFRITKNINSKKESLGASAFLAFDFKPNNDFTNDQLIYTYASGLASSDVLRYQLQKEWIKSNHISYNDALLYFEAHLDYTSYLLLTEYGFSADASNYLNVLNIRHTPNFPESLWNDDKYEELIEFAEANFQFKPQEMKTMAALNALGDPYLYASISSMISYVFKGKTYKKLPLININGVKFMPSFGAHLSPFGLSYTLRSPIQTSNLNTLVALHYGSTYDDTYFGIGLHLLDYKSYKGWQLTPHMELFMQPKFQIGIEDTTSDDDYDEIGGFGGLISLEFERIFDTSNLPLIVNGRIGYKTAGYVPGERIKSAPLISLGIGTLLK